MPEHPSLEDLALYIDGEIADPKVIEAHLECCEDCLSEVVLGRQQRDMGLLGLIPPLTGAEQAATARVTKRCLERLGQTASAKGEDGGKASSVGGWIAGGLGLGALIEALTHHPSPAPALGDQHSHSEPDHGPSHDHNLPDSSDHSEEHGISDNSGHGAVIHGGQSDSEHKEDDSGRAHDLEDFIHRARAVLDEGKDQAADHSEHGAHDLSSHSEESLDAHFDSEHADTGHLADSECFDDHDADHDHDDHSDHGADDHHDHSHDDVTNE